MTAFRLTADAHGNGRIGSGRAEIVSRIPFNLEPKLPLEVNAGDRIDLPLAVVNDTKAPLPVELKLDCGKLVTLDRLAAAKAHAGRRTARPRVLRPQRDRREGPVRSDVPRHVAGASSAAEAAHSSTP